MGYLPGEQYHVLQFQGSVFGCQSKSILPPVLLSKQLLMENATDLFPGFDEVAQTTYKIQLIKFPLLKFLPKNLLNPNSQDHALF